MPEITTGARVSITAGLHKGRPGTALGPPEEGSVDVRLHPLKSATGSLRAITRSFLVSQLHLVSPQPLAA